MIYRRMIFSFILAGGIFLVSCDPEVTTPLPDDTPVTEVSAGPVLSVVEKQNQPINLPNVYILIDDSFSMSDSDNAGEACDLSASRYKLAYFFWNVIEDWKSTGVVSPNQETSVWFLDGNNGNGGQFHNVSKDPKWEILDRLKNGDSISGTTHEMSKIFYGDNIRSSVLESQIPSKSIIIIITDGDFRSTREYKNIDNNDWYDDRNNIATGVQRLKGREIETYFLLLCPRRLDDANLDGLKDTTMLQEWTTILPAYGAHVYGIDKDWNGYPKPDQRDFSSKLYEEINQVLLALYNAYGSGLTWNVVDRNGYGDYVDASMMFFYAGGTSYENDPLQDHPFEIRLDGDLNFPNILIPNNSEECTQHFFSVLDVDDVALIWRQEQLLNFSMPANEKIIFYNDQPSELKIQIPNGVDWSAWKRCLTSKILLSDGTILNSNFEDDSSGEHILKIQSPQNGDTFQEYNLDLIFSWSTSTKEIQKMPLQYMRVYSPEYLYPAKNLGSNAVELNYKFLNKLGSTDFYQPTLFFSNTDCSLFRPNYYKPNGSPYQQGVSVTVEKERYLISFINNSTDFRNCKEMQVQWYDWPGQYLKYKPEIVSCYLDWDDNGRSLNSVECK